MLILQPPLMDDFLRAEWFGGSENGRVQLAVVSSAFFMLWGLGTLFVAGLAEEGPRRQRQA